MAVRMLLLSSNAEMLARELGDANSLDKSSPKILMRVSTLAQALQAVSEFLPEVILIDAAIPGIDSALACRQLLARQQSAKIIVLAVGADDRTLIRALTSGASGYIRTRPTATAIQDCIQTILGDRIYVGPLKEHAGRSRRTSTPARGRNTALDSLSARETEVLTLLADGEKTRDIAEMLYISEKTVETHRSHIVRKLDIHSIAGLTKFALSHGLTTLDKS